MPGSTDSLRHRRLWHGSGLAKLGGWVYLTASDAVPHYSGIGIPYVISGMDAPWPAELVFIAARIIGGFASRISNTVAALSIYRRD